MKNKVHIYIRMLYTSVWLFVLFILFPKESKAEAAYDTTKLCIGLKTNLLYDAAGVLNFGIEYPIDKHFSVVADIAYAYWRTRNHLYALQTLEYGTEFKYWLKPEKRKISSNLNWTKPLKGWNIGIYGHYWQRFDAQYKNGYQGNGSWSAGLICGYAFPISTQFALECSIGGGWLDIPEYRRYKRPEYDQVGRYHLMWKETGKWNGISLTKISISIVWLIQPINKRGTKL